MRRKLKSVSDVAVTDVSMLFPSDTSNSVDGFEARVTAVAYIPEFTQFVLKYLERIQRLMKLKSIKTTKYKSYWLTALFAKAWVQLIVV